MIAMKFYWALLVVMVIVAEVVTVRGFCIKVLDSILDLDSSKKTKKMFFNFYCIAATKTKSRSL